MHFLVFPSFNTLLTKIEGIPHFLRKGPDKEHLTEENTLTVSHQMKSQSKSALVLPSMARGNNGLSTSNQLEHQQDHD